MSNEMIETSKNCLWCYLPFEYRKKWEKNWNEVKYCSDKCRDSAKNKKRLNERELMESKILEMTKDRSPKSICPSEVVRDLFEDWRTQMEPVRQICRKLHLEQKIKITQNEKIIKSLNFKGPIRIKFVN